MSVLRSLLTAGVLATGLLWAAAASATPQIAQENAERPLGCYTAA